MPSDSESGSAAFDDNWGTCDNGELDRRITFVEAEPHPDAGDPLVVVEKLEVLPVTSASE